MVEMAAQFGTALSGATPRVTRLGAAEAPTAVDLASSPGWLPPPGTMSMLRQRRRLRRMMRQINSGRWKDVLIGLKQTQHRFKEVRRHDGKIAELLVKANLVALALRFHASVIFGRGIGASVPEAFGEQQAAIEAIRRRVLFDTLAFRSIRKVNVEAEAALRIDVQGGGDAGVILCLDSNEVTLPVGAMGADGQPTVWERRWIIEKPHATDKRKVERFLRIERHRAPEGVGLIEQEAYRVVTSDVLVELDGKNVERVPLETALGAEHGLAERIETGLPHPMIVQLVNDLDEAAPQFIINEHDLDIIDAVAAAFSRLDRSHEQHATPKLRIPPESIDPKTGEVNLGHDAIVDPEKRVEYLVQSLELAAMLEFLDRTLDLMLVMLQMSKALLGFKPGGGSAPDSFDKLRLESTNTLDFAMRATRYIEPALERLLTLATMVESRLPMRGFAIAPVNVRMRPEIPKDSVEIAREQSELLRERLTSRRRAVAAIHGDDQVEAVMAEISEDEAAESARQRSALFGAMGEPVGDDGGVE